VRIDKIKAKKEQCPSGQTRTIDGEQEWSDLWHRRQQTKSGDLLLTHGLDDVIINKNNCGFG